MNAKRAARQSEKYQKILDKKGKRNLIRFLNIRIKYAIKEGKTFVTTLIGMEDPMWKHLPYVVEYFEAKGYYCSCEISTLLDNDYVILVKWGETQKKEGIDNNG